MSGFRPFPSSNRLRHGGQRLDDREREPMPPSTPEQRFEVPPEYAEVYERAYRRAYEEGLGQLSSGEDAQPPRGSSLSRPRGRRGSRLSRASHRPMEHPRDDQWTHQWPGHEDRADATSQREPVP